ncbi:MAG: lipopolysaccharide biosynthesis protein [Huintestinicola sp.]|uniref:lipopolysaccharide biosynthesis protein n=1 Tax=Huintestinicola sp. TaxID=2981661 RepID=UPI003F078E13
MTRTQASLKNLITAFIGQAAGILISFIARRAFLDCLDEQYLGISGLFSNILTVLSLAELGVGSAMTFALYKPLAENDISLVRSLMRLYKRAYNAIGAAVLVLAVLFVPIYPRFMDEVPDIPHLTAIYLLYAANTGISYFFSYKRTLIICDQKRYVATMYHYGFYFALNIAQIAVLYATRNYLLFTAMQLLFTAAENIAVSLTADRMYPYLRDKDVSPLPEATLCDIKKNVRAMLMHKVGSIVVLSTDNILISKLVGIASTGIYSNYYLITNALERVIGQIFTSISAGVGDLNASGEDKSRLMTSFYRIFFMSFWIMGFSFVCLVCLFNPFICLWLKTDSLIFGMDTVVLISAVFFLTGMRKSVLTYREAAGAFYYDRYKPIVESLVNIIASIVLARVMGVSGIFLGTVISTLTVCIWVEPYVLFKHVFRSSPKKYFCRLLLYTAVTGAVCALTYFVCGCVTIASPLWDLAVRVLICALLPNLIFLALFGRTEEFKFFLKLLTDIISGKLKK